VANNDEILYVGDFSEIMAFDISNPSTPELLARHELPSFVDNIFIKDTIIVVNSNWSTIIVKSNLEAGSQEPYLCGDANSDDNVNVSDAVYIINWVFLPEAPAPIPIQSGETNCDGDLNISDAVWLILYIFDEGNNPCDSNGDGIPDC
jgi:hypothetical protein